MGSAEWLTAAEAEALTKKLTHLRWDQERLQFEWKFWDKPTRDHYLFWREELTEWGVKDRLLMANAAAQNALLSRIVRGGAAPKFFHDAQVRALMERMNTPLPRKAGSGSDPLKKFAEVAKQTSLLGDDPAPPAKKRERSAEDDANEAGGAKKASQAAPKKRKTTRSVS